MLLSPGAAQPADDPQPTDPEMARIYEELCADCHESEFADLPGRERLAKLPPAKIVKKLTVGTMKVNASRLTPAQIEALAAFLGSAPRPIPP